MATSGGYPFSPFICLLAALVMIYPSLVPLDFGKLKISLKDHKLIFISLFFNFLISPALALLLGYVFLNENPNPLERSTDINTVPRDKETVKGYFGMIFDTIETPHNHQCGFIGRKLWVSHSTPSSNPWICCFEGLPKIHRGPMSQRSICPYPGSKTMMFESPW